MGRSEGRYALEKTAFDYQKMGSVDQSTRETPFGTELTMKVRAEDRLWAI